MKLFSKSRKIWLWAMVSLILAIETFFLLESYNCSQNTLSLMKATNLHEIRKKDEN